MKVLIIGLGVSGKAALEFCQKRGDEVTIFEEGVDVNAFDLIVKSPGVPMFEAKVPIVGEIDLALEVLKEKKILGITGSNGKTTTTLLAAHLLNISGKKAIACGNIGTPLVSLVESDAEYFVVELSSYQLESMSIAPHFDAGVILNITPNHLDRHKTFEAYKAAKWRLKKCLKPKGRFYTSFDKERVETILPLGYRYYPHDVENIAAALAITEVDDRVLVEGVETFKKPPHRIEFVKNVRGVTFINDSKSTSVDATIKAVDALNEPIVLIVGGVDKGGAYDRWRTTFKGKVKKVFLLGAAAKSIESALGQDVASERVVSLEEAVEKAANFSQVGESVLLSPGCSSFDQFKNFEHRGQRFKELVCALKEI